MCSLKGIQSHSLLIFNILRYSCGQYYTYNGFLVQNLEIKLTVCKKAVFLWVTKSLNPCYFAMPIHFN